MNKKFDFHKEHKYVNQYENKRKAGDSIENKDAFNMGYDAGLSDRVTGHKNEINDRDQWVNAVLESAGFDLTEENLHDFKEGYWTGYEMESYHEETGEEAVREPHEEVKAEDSNAGSALDNWLQDVAQITGEITYNDIKEVNQTNIKEIRKLRREWRELLKEDPEAEDELFDIGKRVKKALAIKAMDEDNYEFVEEMHHFDYAIEFYEDENTGKFAWYASYEGDQRSVSNFNIYADIHDIQLSGGEEGILSRDRARREAMSFAEDNYKKIIGEDVDDKKAEDSKYSEEYHYLQDKLLEYERKGIGTKKEYERNRARLAEIQDLEWNEDEQLNEYSFEVPEDLAELIRNDEYDAENLIYWFRDDFGHEVEIAYDDGLLTFYNMNEEELERAKELEDESEEWYDEVLEIIND